MTASSQLLIQTYERTLEKLQKQFEAVAEAALFADPAKRVELELQQADLLNKLQATEATLKALTDAEQDIVIETLVTTLKAIYQQAPASVMAAYQKTLPTRTIRVGLESGGAIARDLLQRPQDDDSPPWLHRFVGLLLPALVNQDAVPVALINDLRQWAETQIPNYAALAQTLQQGQEPESCFLVRVRSAPEVDPSRGDLYYVEAWWIEAVEAYRQNPPTGAKPVHLPAPDPAAGTAPGQTYTVSELEATVRQLRHTCRTLYGAERPWIHIFLPTALLNTDVDCWRVKTGRRQSLRDRLGVNQRVVVRAGDRLERSEFELSEEWQTKWTALAQRFATAARDPFQPGDPHQPDALYAMGQKPEVLAVQLNQALSQVNADQRLELLETLLLDTAIPLAIWLRQGPETADASTLEQLSQVLQAFCPVQQTSYWSADQCLLEKLPELIWRTRLRVLEIPADQSQHHAGHHLTLLWDDPTLLPPQRPPSDVA